MNADTVQNASLGDKLGSDDDTDYAELVGVNERTFQVGGKNNENIVAKPSTTPGSKT